MATLTRKSPAGAHKPFANYSHVVTTQGANKLVFCAGQVAADSTGKVLPPDDFAAQTKMVMENLKLALAEGGASLRSATTMLRSRSVIRLARILRHKFAGQKQMIRIPTALVIIAILSTSVAFGQNIGINDIYTARASVTGKDERNRPLGFRLCFEEVLVKSTGDARILLDHRVAAFTANAAQNISTFSYRDLLEGLPIHDEQGTYDRPYILTCQFNPEKINHILSALGRKPWLGVRPRVVMVLVVHTHKETNLLARNGPFDPAMRESLDDASYRYGLTVVLPTMGELHDFRNPVLKSKGPDDRFSKIAASTGAGVILLGDLQWSDAALGWIAAWTLKTDKKRYQWSIKGVNFDEAFRNAVRGTAGILAGYGNP
jgi:hypothetical protein